MTSYHFVCYSIFTRDQLWATTMAACVNMYIEHPPIVSVGKRK